MRNGRRRRLTIETLEGKALLSAAGGHHAMAGMQGGTISGTAVATQALQADPNSIYYTINPGASGPVSPYGTLLVRNDGVHAGVFFRQLDPQVKGSEGILTLTDTRGTAVESLILLGPPSTAKAPLPTHWHFIAAKGDGSAIDPVTEALHGAKGTATLTFPQGLPTPGGPATAFSLTIKGQVAH